MFYDQIKTKEIIIGILPIQEIITEETIAKIDSKSKLVKKDEFFKISIYKELCPTPHIHLIGHNKDICIKIDKPEYFDHGGHLDLLSSDEKKCFLKFYKLNASRAIDNISDNDIKQKLNQLSNEEKKNLTFWQLSQIVWNSLNQNYQYNIEKEPNYKKLETE